MSTDVQVCLDNCSNRENNVKLLRNHQYVQLKWITKSPTLYRLLPLPDEFIHKGHTSISILVSVLITDQTGSCSNQSATFSVFLHKRDVTLPYINLMISAIVYGWWDPHIHWLAGFLFNLLVIRDRLQAVFIKVRML